MSDFWSRPLSPSVDALHQELGGETVLLNLRSEQYFGLDEVGTRIWQLVTEGATAEAIVAQLLAEYDADEATIRGDVERLLQELAGAGLLANGAG
jgi:hypothetical protein